MFVGNFVSGKSVRPLIDILAPNLCNFSPSHFSSVWSHVSLHHFTCVVYSCTFTWICFWRHTST